MAIMLICLVLMPAGAGQAGLPAAGEEQLSTLDLTGVQRYVDQLDAEIKVAVPTLDFKETVARLARGEIHWRPEDIFRELLRQLFKEVVANFSLLGKLIVLAVVCAVLQNMLSAFERGSTGRLAHAVTYLALVTIALGSFTLAVNTGRQVVDGMVNFMQALLPVLLTMLVAVGGVTSAAVMSPVLLTALALFGTLIKNFILPLLLFAAVLGIMSNLTDRINVSNLAGLFNSVAMGTLGVATTIFTGILALQGVAGAVGDSLTIRTAKFATDAFIPVVGGVFSDALEAVVGTSLLIKNAVGIAGMAIIAAAMVTPLLKIITLSFIYKLSGALIQPIGDGQTAGCLNDLGKSLLLVFAAVATAGLLFFFSVAIVVGVGNITVMLR
ncbi:MAG: stage III sporulation protein AE [Firmicutes bacterium]|nr:stage III sporulation protein AE [Bacillota bacterium]